MRRPAALTFAATLVAVIITALAVAPALAGAQLIDTKAISTEAARAIAQAAEQEAIKNGWKVSIAVVDANGALIHFQRMNDVSPASVDISQAKARTAARFRRPTKMLEETITAGRTVMLGIEGMLAMEGGVPVIVDGKVIGAVGVSGATSAQDAQMAAAGIAALKP